MKYINLAGAVIMVLLFYPAHATVWYVHPDSAMNCIQYCLDSCSIDDTVLVGPGTYYENINWPNMHGIDLISENGPDSTIIDGGGTARVIELMAAFTSTTTIKGFTIQNGYGNSAGGGIYCWNGASPLIRANVITNNEADSMGAGIQCSFNSSPMIDSNQIVNNISHYVGSGIGCYENCHPTIQNNTIEDNNADFGSTGICLAFGCAPLITGNTITGNTGGYWFGGIGATSNCSPTITNNEITNNHAMWGAGIGLEGYGAIIDNEITGNSADSMGGGIAAYTNSSCIIENNFINSNAAFKGGGIWVHQNSHPAISNNTITANTASSGAGIRCSDYSHPLIQNNTIQNNVADSVGGGITCVYGSSPMIEGNMINWNTVNSPGGAGIFCMENCSPNIIDNTIEHNTVNNGWGGGIWCYLNCSPAISDNSIKYNYALRGGGVNLYQQCSPVTFEHNIISYNISPEYGAGIDCIENCSPYIDSCTIAHNNGDGIRCEDNSNPEIHHVNISGNTGYGLNNNDPLITIDADNNWWGHSTGPFQSLYNPTGQGDSVSYFVDFDPWLTDSVAGVGIEEFVTSTPSVLSLQVSPNPCRYTTTIRYSILDARYSMQNPTLSIYDATGRLVKSFDLGSSIENQESCIYWSGIDDANRKVASGIYFVKLSAGDCVESKNLLLIR